MSPLCRTFSDIFLAKASIYTSIINSQYGQNNAQINFYQINQECQEFFELWNNRLRTQPLDYIILLLFPSRVILHHVSCFLLVYILRSKEIVERDYYIAYITVMRTSAKRIFL